VSRVVLASFDRVPDAKGASAHILANAAILGRKHEVSLISLGTEPMPGLRHRPIHVPEPNWLRRAQLFHERVLRVLAGYDFDVYHVRSPWEGLATPLGRRLVYEVNAFYSIEAQYHFPDTINQPSIRGKLRTLEMCLLDRSDLVITPSTVTARYLEDLGVPAQRIAVVPNAPSIAEPASGADARAAVAPNDVLELCYIGTLAPWQGLPELISILPRMTVPFHLTVLTAASSWRARRLVRLARKRGLADRITLREPMDPAELGAFLATQDIALAPLIPCERNLVQGCMPIKLLDYALAGLPVLAPDMPVVRDVLGPDYRLYRRWGRSGMAELLDELMRAPALRQELAALGREHVRRSFSHARQDEALHAAYARMGV
jgi:glycosyltransferase involved in cell wall biosynthesis